MKKSDPPRRPVVVEPDAELEHSERELFLSAMRDFGASETAERGGSVAGTGAKKADRQPPPAEQESPRAQLPAGQAEDQQFLAAMRQLGATPDKDRPAARSTPAAPRRLRAAKLRQLTVDDRLDLHGRRVEEALLLVETFVATAVRQGSRTVLVITGKGLHSPAGAGVLRRAVEQWIERRGKPKVVAWAEAPRELGGRGAFVLHLRRT